MFFLYFVILEWMVALEAAFAYRNGFLYRGQGSEPRPGHRISFYIEHGGMWGDLVFVSAIVASMISRGLPYWTMKAYAFSGVISLVLSMAMLKMWAGASKDMDDSFMKDGNLTACGAIHGLYMFVAIATLILYYAFTPVVATTPMFRAIVSVLLMIHIIAGVIQPDWHTNGSISLNTWLTAGGAWTILLGAWLYPYILR